MRNDTHSAIILQDGKPLAFVDGIPDRCEHDDNGEWLHFNDNGEYFRDSEVPKTFYASRKFWKKNKINGGCCSCSKCGKPFRPDFFSMP